jgi:dihydropteroate synthase
MKIGSRNFNWGTKTFVMGIINVTDDSFSGDGIAFNLKKVEQQAMDFKKNGADFIDVGGESSRPASVYGEVKSISIQEEIDRVIPAIRLINQKIDIPISIDSKNTPVITEAIKNGATIINDVSMHKHDPNMISLVSELNLPYILVHNIPISDGTNILQQIKLDLIKSIDVLLKSGLDSNNIIIDPGIGFNKNTQQNLEIINKLDQLKIDYPILIGTSRKKHIGETLNLKTDDRIEGTAATTSIAIDRGADIIRVHDVKEIIRVARMTDALVREKITNKNA